MPFSTTDTEILYDGNNVDSTFAFSWYFVDHVSGPSTKAEIYDMTLDDPAYNAISLVYNVDYTVTGSVVSLITTSTDPVTGDPVVDPRPLLTTEKLRIYRDSVDYHDTNYSTYQFPYGTVNVDLDRVYLRLQELRREVDRAIKLNRLSLDGGETLTGEEIIQAMEDLQTLIDNMSTGAGLPTGGADGDFIERRVDPVTAAESGAWMSGSYDGFSLLTNAQFTSTGLKDTLDKIIRITYTAPTISLSASPAQTVREKGTPIASVDLTASTIKRSDPIAQVRFYRAGVLVNTIISPNANGGIETYTDSTPFSDNMTFTAQVTDDGSTGGPSNVTSNTVTYTFVYPYYSGAGAVGLTPVQVAALTKDVRTSTASLNKTFTTSNGDVYYFAYPASYGPLTSILDENGFETFGDWTLTTTNITGLDGNPVSYRIYEFNNPVVAGSTNYTFKR